MTTPTQRPGRGPWHRASAVLGAAALLASASSAQAQAAHVIEPNDPSAFNQWHLADMHAYNAWQMLQDVPKMPTTVAVIDTNIELGYDDLENRLVTGWDTRNDWPYKTAVAIGAAVHGTFVASTLAAEVNNGVRGAGVAGPLPIRIMPLKYVNQGDLCGAGLCDDPAVEQAASRAFIEALQFALGDNDDGAVASVINVSSAVMLTEEQAAAYEPLFQEARDKGVFIVAGAGNLHVDLDRLEGESYVQVKLDPTGWGADRKAFYYETDLPRVDPALVELWQQGTTDQITLDGVSYERSVSTVYAQGQKSYPAAFADKYDNVLGVTGSDRDGNLWQTNCSMPGPADAPLNTLAHCVGSSFGSIAPVAAPSDQLNCYAALGGLVQSGTSYGTPMVSAAAAMLRSVRPELTPAEVIDLLTAGTDVAAIQDGTLGPDDRLDLVRVLQAAGFEDPGAPRREQALSEPIFNAETRTMTFTDDAVYDLDGSIVERLWIWGDGTAEVVQGSTQAQHAYEFPGEYDVTLVAVDDDDHSYNFTQTFEVQGSSKDVVTIEIGGAEPYRLEGVLQTGNIENRIAWPGVYFMQGQGTVATAGGTVRLELDMNTGWFGQHARGELTIVDPSRPGPIVVQMSRGEKTNDPNTDTFTFSEGEVTVTVRDTDG